MRSISFLSLSFVVASFALAGCAVGSGAPDDLSSSQEINGKGEVVSVSRDATPSLPEAAEARSPNANDRAFAETSDLLEKENVGRLGQTENIRDVIAERKVGELADGTEIRVDGTLATPDTIAQRINAAGEGRAVIHQATGTPFDHRQLSDDPEGLVGVDGNP